MIEAQLKGLVELRKALKAVQEHEKKALTRAIKIEGYRLMRVMKAEIRAGAPGGRKFAERSTLARRLNTGSYLRGDADIEAAAARTGTKKALGRMALAIRYFIQGDAMMIGFSGPKISKSWKRLAYIHQTGFTSNVTDELRREARRSGAKMSRRSKTRQHMFLLKATTRMRTPARPIIDPFWAAHQNQAWANIRDNYRRKLKGERI